MIPMVSAQCRPNRPPRAKPEPRRSQALTLFTDPLAALEEAQFQAKMTGWPQAIVNGDQGMTVMAKHRAHGMEILEVVHG